MTFQSFNPRKKYNAQLNQINLVSQKSCYQQEKKQDFHAMEDIPVCRQKSVLLQNLCKACLVCAIHCSRGINSYI